MSPQFLMQWSSVIFLIALEITIVYLICAGKIDMTKLISENDGTASFSRFQFLIFTFLFASILVVTAFPESGGFQWPNIPYPALGLMGISGTGYLVSKNIQGLNKSREK